MDQRIKKLVPASTRWAQIATRWVSVLAGAIVAVLVGQAVDASVAGTGLGPSWWALSLLCVLIAGGTSGLAVSAALGAQVSSEKKLRELSQRSWFKLGPFRTETRIGELLDLATNGSTRTSRYRAGFLSASVAALSAPIIVLVVIGLAVSWKAAGLMATVVVGGPIIIGAFQGMSSRVGNRFRASQSKLRASFLEGIRALESLAYAGATSAYAKQLAELNEVHRRKIMRLLAGNQILILVMDLVFSLAAFALATYTAVQGRISEALSLGQALSLLLLTVMLVAPVDLIGQFFYIGIGGRAAQRQYSALLFESESAAAQDDELRKATYFPRQRSREDDLLALRVNDVSVGWPGAPNVLGNVSFSVNEGEKITLVGPSGAGKSTLSAAIQGLLPPRSGNIVIAVSDNSVRQSAVSAVEQRSFLFSDSIAQNLRIAKPDASEEELWDALEQANMADDVRSMPAGLMTQVGDRGALLSGGQVQRLAIARALLKDGPILVLDEPTSQVDLRGEALILEAIDRVSEGKAVITIAHRSAPAAQADRVLAVDGGNVEEVRQERRID